MKFKIIALLIIAALVLIIILQNTHAITLHILFWDVVMSLVILVLLMLLVGFALGYVAARRPRSDE